MNTYAFNWAISLLIEPNNSIEQRLLAIAEYFALYCPGATWKLSDIDATGEKGGKLTTLINAGQSLQLTHNELIGFIRENGQIFELSLFLLEKSTAIIQIIVRTGSTIDILGAYERLPLAVTGPVMILDLSLFCIS